MRWWAAMLALTTLAAGALIARGELGSIVLLLIAAAWLAVGPDAFD